jgi:hypothetical protein
MSRSEGTLSGMRLPLVVVAVVACTFVSSGCSWFRYKGVEGFNAATTPVDYEANRHLWKGDEYASGGIAKGSGGLITTTNYGKGADPNSPEPVNPRLDQPEKGIGQNPGEFHADHATGYGLTNSPISQSSPSDAGSLAARAGQP